MAENTGFQRVILITLLVHDKVFIDLKIHKDSFLKSPPFFFNYVFYSCVLSWKYDDGILFMFSFNTLTWQNKMLVTIVSQNVWKLLLLFEILNLTEILLDKAVWKLLHVYMHSDLPNHQTKKQKYVNVLA